MADSTHRSIVHRLKRADGHLHAIVEMIEQGRPCVQIAERCRLESAIENAERVLIHHHISECIERPLKASESIGRTPLKELRLSTKSL
jgi:uncharacterized protein